MTVTLAEAPPATRAPSQLGRTLAVLAAMALLVNAQIYNVIPLFDELSVQWQASPAAVTWMSSAITIGYAASFLLVGPLTDRFDRRRMLVIGGAATSLATVLVALAPSLAVGVALRVVQGFAAGVFGPATFAYIASRVDPHRRTMALSTVVSAFLAAAVFGQVTGQLLVSVGGWRLTYITSAAALAVATVALHLVIRPDRPSAPAISLGGVYRAIPRLLVRRDLAPLYGAALTMLGGFVAVYAALQIVVAMDETALLSLRASALPAIIAAPLLAPWLSRFQPDRRAQAAALVGAAAIAAVGVFRPTGVGLALVLLVFVGGIAISAPAINEAIGSRAETARGTAISLFTTVLMIGASAGPLLVGALSSAGVTTVFLVIAAIAAAGAVAPRLSGSLNR